MPLNKTEALRHAQQFALQGNLTSAITVYEKIVAADPADLAALSALGDLYVKAQRAPEAIEKFSRIAESCLERGSAVHAAYYLRKALEIEPSNALVRMRLGEIYTHEGLTEKAHEAFVQAGAAFRQSGNLAEAMAANQQALSVKANSRPATEAIVVLQRELAQQARPLPGRALDHAPQDLLMEFDALNAMRASRSLNDASTASKAASLGEEQIVERISTAELLVAYGQVDDAVAMLKEVLEQKPGNVDVHIKLKDIYLRSEMTEAAAEECLEISRIYGAHGDTERAKDYVIRAQRLIPAHEAKSALPISTPEGRREPSESLVATAASDAPAVMSDAEWQEALADQSMPLSVEMVLPALPAQPAVEEAAAVIEIVLATQPVIEKTTAQPAQPIAEQATVQPVQPVTEEAVSQPAQSVIEAATLAQPSQSAVEESASTPLAQPDVEAAAPAPPVRSSLQETPVTPHAQPSAEAVRAASPAQMAVPVAVIATPLIDATLSVERDETRMPVAESDDHAIAASESTAAVLSDTAPALIDDAVSATMVTASTTTATTMTKEQPRTLVVAAAGGKSRKGLYGVALMVGLLVIAASVAIPVYKSRLNQKPEAVAQQAEPPAVSSELPSGTPQESQPPAVTPQPVEQIEVRASDPPSAGVDKPARIEKERPEKNITEVPYVEPPAKPAPEPARVSVSPNANKPTVLAPPRVASAPNAQNGAEPRGESASLPRNATGMPEPPPLPTATAPDRKSSVITPSQSAHTVQPDYPQLAKSTRQSGMVVVEVTINDRGDVTGARATSGPSLLREAAVSAARRWKFKPAMRDGKPIGSSTTLSFNFKM